MQAERNASLVALIFFVILNDINANDVIIITVTDIIIIKYKGYPFSVAVGTAHYDKSIDFDVPSTKIILARSDKEMYNHKQEIKKFTKEFQHESQ